MSAHANSYLLLDTGSFECVIEKINNFTFTRKKVHRGSYRSTHVLLNLLNELRKSNKMRDLHIILLLFRKELNKFNNPGAGMLDSIYHMTLK